MPKKIKNVFYEKLTFQKFIEAHNRAKQQKMYKNEVLLFDLNLESNIISIMKAIENGRYKFGKYHTFKVYEPKERIIQSLPYRDRVVHQWYVEEFIKPYIMPKFINTSFACLPEKGTHKAVLTAQKMMRIYRRKYPNFYVLKCDIKKYFNNIDSNILYEILQKYISDKALLKFTYQILKENRPFESAVGIPIGNYTSQYFANIYLNELDQFVKRTLHIHEYIRYMDDFLLYLPNKEECIKYKKLIEEFLKEKLKLELNYKSKYYPNQMGVNFCGYRIFATHRLLRTSSKTKIKNNVRKWNKQYKAGCLDLDFARQSFNSWWGHSSYCNSYNLQQKILNKCDFLVNMNFEKNRELELHNLIISGMSENDFLNID